MLGRHFVLALPLAELHERNSMEASSFATKRRVIGLIKAADGGD
jgi:hypothetical protein